MNNVLDAVTTTEVPVSPEIVNQIDNPNQTALLAASLEGVLPQEKIDLSTLIMLNLTLGQPGVRKKVKSGEVEVKSLKGAENTDNHDVDPKAVSVSKVVLQCEEFDNILSCSRAVRKFVSSRALQFSFVKNGMYLLPPRLVKETVARIKVLFAERAAAIENFIAVYPQRVEEQKQLLGGLFDARDYPDAVLLQKAFTQDYSLIGFNTPETLAEIDPEILEEERQKKIERTEAAMREIEEALMEGAKEFVDYLVDRLSPDEKGEQKVFHASAIENVKDFFDTLSDKNITNSPSIEALAIQGKSMLDGVDAETLRKSKTLRDTIQTRLNDMKPFIEDSLQNKPERAVSLR